MLLKAATQTPASREKLNMLTNGEQRKGHTKKKGQEGPQERWHG